MGTIAPFLRAAATVKRAIIRPVVIDAVRHRSTVWGVDMQLQVALPVAGWAAWTGPQNASPDVSFIEPQLRRRLSFLDRIALQVMHACVKPHEQAQLLFASRHGELARSAQLLAQLAAQEVPSPMGFSLSVLNAAVGLYGIACGNRAASSAISAGEATFPMALLEGASQVASAPQAAVVVVFADEPPPAVYAELVDSPKAPVALAVRLEAGAPAMNMGWQPSATSANDDAEAGPAAFLRCMEQGVPSSWQGGGYAWHWSRRAA